MSSHSESTTTPAPAAPQAATDEVLVRGVVRRITFRNPENGYTVMRLGRYDRLEQTTVVGTCLHVENGVHLLVRGKMVTHPKFGEQLVATSITETAPPTKEGLERYLGSGRFKGIGKKTAQRLVEAFGENALEVIMKEPEKLASVPGLPKAKLKEVAEMLGAQRVHEEAIQFLVTHQVGPRLAEKIVKRYGNRTAEVIKRDPYQLARDVAGVGFATADAIAGQFEIAHDSPQRLKAGVYYALERSSDDGNCFLPTEEATQRARQLLQLDDSFDLTPQLDELVQEGYLARTRSGVALVTLDRAEEFVAAQIAERTTPRAEPIISEPLLEDSLKEAATHLGIEFSPQQTDAVRAAARHKLMVITGGPGCGKTTVIRALVAMFRRAGRMLMLAAPTGRAAQRMAQVCDYSASTIHRLLKFDPSSGKFQFNLEQKLLCDALIVDEASMLDILLARDLFAALPPNATLVVVGDRDQLPSVGPGRVFGDLLSVPAVHTVQLSRLYRRAEESRITTTAHQINAGLMPDIPTPDGTTKSDAYFIPKATPEEALSVIEKLCADQLQKKFGFQTQDVMVLTPGNRGDLGTQKLNERLQDALNPSRDPEQELVLDKLRLRIGDRVCQRVNNYQIDEYGVFNGDLGIVHGIDKAKQTVVVELWDGRLIKYPFNELGQLSLAYALTVHRSQGSEIPCVVLAMHESHFTLLERQLFYTGVTRAKKLLVVVGSKRALKMAAERMRSKKRYTSLRERILERTEG